MSPLPHNLHLLLSVPIAATPTPTPTPMPAPVSLPGDRVVAFGDWLSAQVSARPWLLAVTAVAVLVGAVLVQWVHAMAVSWRHRRLSEHAQQVLILPPVSCRV